MPINWIQYPDSLLFNTDDKIIVSEPSGNTKNLSFPFTSNSSGITFTSDIYFTNLTEAEQEFSVMVGPDGKLYKSTHPGERSRIQIRNDEGTTIPAGAPIYSKGEVGGSERIKVGICNSSDPAKMPCIGIVETELNTTDNKDGFATTQGVYNTNISGFTGLSEGDILYVNGGSAPHLTQTKPTSGDLIQNVGVVIKTNGTICQGLLVAAIGRTNDVPWPLYVDHTNQRVGIGTTSPSEKLHVVGNVRISEVLYISSLNQLLRVNNNEFEINNYSSDKPILFKTSDGGSIGERMRLTSNGNLGIGTTSPSQLIDVASSGTNTNAPTFRITNTANNSASNWNGKISHAIEFYSADPSRVGLASSIQNIAGTNKGGVLTGNITFNTADWPTSGIAERMRITDSGFVGIGTSSPNRKIHVVSSEYVIGDFVRSSGTNAYLSFQDSTTSGSGFVGVGAAGNSLLFRAGNVEHMRLTSNLLIGTTTDDGSNKLQVNGGIKSSNTITADTYFQSSDTSAVLATASAGSVILRPNGAGSGTGALTVGLSNTTISNTLNGTTATFSGQVTIPATPVASTDAASKGYVDAQIGANNDLQEITDNGATTTNDMTISNGAPAMILKDSTSGSSTVIARNSFRNNVNTEVGTVGFLGDGDLRLTNVLSNNITFYTSNAEKMRITSGGNLGLGVTSVGAKLDMKSSAMSTNVMRVITSDGSTGAVWFEDNSGDLWYQMYDASANEKIRLRSDSSSFFNGGNVGIGQTSPAHKLDVAGYIRSANTGADSNTKYSQFLGRHYTNSEEDILAISTESTSSSNNIYIGGGFSSRNSATTIKFSTASNNTTTTGSERMRVTNTGNVLIGTTTDSGAKLEVNGGVGVATSGAFILRQSADTSGGGFSLTSSNALSHRIWKNSSGSLNIGTSSNPSQFVQMTNGNTLIGTTSDSGAKLQVKSSSVNTIPFQVTNNASTNAIFSILQDGGGDGRARIFNSSGTLNVNLDSSGNSYFNGGNLGIGTANPAHKLDISGGKIQISDGGATWFGSDATGGFIRTFNGNTFRFLSSSLGETMRIVNSTNNVLIGTTTDVGAKLYVNGHIRIANLGQIYGNGTGDIYLGNTNSGVLRIGGDGTDTVIQPSFNNLVIKTTRDIDNIVFKAGASEDTYITLDSSLGYTVAQKTIRFNDNVKGVFGNASDLQIFHDASNSYIYHGGTGNLYIKNETNDQDVVLQCDDGSGGITPYITLDGSQTTINLQKTVLIGTTTNTGAYKIDVAGKQRVQDTLELDDVLMLNQISTPADPAAGKSVIYMDSADGGIKCKINVGGTVVTRTLASFE